MYHLDNLACYEHLLFLCQANINFLVGCYEFAEVHIAEVTIARSSSTAEDIILMWFGNLGCRCDYTVFVLRRCGLFPLIPRSDGRHGDFILRWIDPIH